MGKNIFISYRRSDSAPVAGRIYDQLIKIYPKSQIFMDVDSIEPGAPFADVLRAKLAKSAVVLAIIGPDWVTACDESGRRRLDDPGDFVRMEIETALALGKRIIPVLVNGAGFLSTETLPPALQPIAALNAEQLLHHRFGTDIEALRRKLRAITPPQRTPGQWLSIGLAVAALVAGALFVGQQFMLAPEQLDDRRRELARTTAQTIDWSRPDSGIYNWLLDVYSAQMARSQESHTYGNEPYRIHQTNVEDRAESGSGYLVWWPSFCTPADGCRHDVLRFGEKSAIGTFSADNIKTTNAYLNGRTIFIDSDGRFVVWTGARYEKQP